MLRTGLLAEVGLVESGNCFTLTPPDLIHIILTILLPPFLPAIPAAVGGIWGILVIMFVSTPLVALLLLIRKER